MRALQGAICALCLSLVAACDGAVVPSEPAPPERSEEAIVGGTPTAGDWEVFLLFIQADTGRSSTCTATLIAPRTLLTAAHCVDPSAYGAQSLALFAANVPTQAQVQQGVNTVGVLETRLHPNWNPAAGLKNDLALALLQNPPAQPPKPWSRQPLEGRGGRAVRALGYGASGVDGGGGIKRTVDLTIRQLSPELISLGNLVDKGICNGDSGGPTFLTFDDGVERLIGVHSFTRTEDCLDGADTRVDSHVPFILQWLSEKEDACGQNLICSLTRCSPPDPDCLTEGSPCDSPFECPGRVCASDAQHPTPYCSKSCSGDIDCGPSLRCDTGRGVCHWPQLSIAQPGETCIPGASFCSGDFICSGRSAALARCRKPCTTQSQCTPGQHCLIGSTGRQTCEEQPPVTLPVERGQWRAAQSCSAGWSPWPACAVMALWTLLARPRAASRAQSC